MTDKLKPCPFCGGDGVLCQEQEQYWIECIVCNARSSAIEDYFDDNDYNPAELARESWNRRAKRGEHND